jgi:hypothetical protein
MHIVNEIKKDNESIPFVCLAILTWAGFHVMGQEVPQLLLSMMSLILTMIVQGLLGI